MIPDSDRRIAETTVEPDSSGVRLDFYLQKRFSYRSRTEWQKSIAEGEILLNGRQSKPSRRLQAGERIAFLPRILEEPPVDASFEVLEETPDYLIVSKSGNLPCHPAGVFFHHTLWYALRKEFGEKIHIATRLDRETSGVVLAARNSRTAAEFTRALSSQQVHKRYLAIVYGTFPEEYRADGYLSSDPSAAVRKKRRFTEEIPPDGERAETLFRCLSSRNNFSLVEAVPRTGRLHQIRATLCSLGFPLVGDKLYGPDETLFTRFLSDSLTEADRARLLLPRQALHAASLRFPFRGEILQAEAPLPADMSRLCGELFSSESVFRSSEENEGKAER